MTETTDDEDSPLGSFIRRQRELQELSMRQFADLVGISNPYLSQIERGLREPSEKVIDAMARNLELSAESLQQRAGRRSPRGGESAVERAIREDPGLSASQRRSLLEVYRALISKQSESAR